MNNESKLYFSIYHRGRTSVGDETSLEDVHRATSKRALALMTAYTYITNDSAKGVRMIASA